MAIGDVVYFISEGGLSCDYGIVTSKNDYMPIAYWIAEESFLNFNTINSCFTKVAPSALGKWND